MANYITVSEAQAYADERLNVEAWSTAKETDGSNWGDAGTLCVKAITMATKAIDRLNYRGSKLVATQANQFPRGTDTTAPGDIMRACFEIALALLDGVDPEIETENLQLTMQNYANMKASYDRSVASPYFAAGIISATAWRYLLPYLRDVKKVNIMRTS